MSPQMQSINARSVLHSVKPKWSGLSARLVTLNGGTVRLVYALFLLSVTVFSRHAGRGRAVTPPAGC
ncbi:hypothetical protein DSJ_26375 (plasmid) [Pantoea stewartii subsp. stewartii DC283]|uniref:Uncharacterized protein n=1 Tax=Pantoea stewartii subsp. stewartii DC283 TaxID=660596 RepID=A0ABM6KDN1_PANSE|nr:hypothetical protein DSJ_26375 [Pantoea stewartii subsp. stewartii DC283]